VLVSRKEKKANNVTRVALLYAIDRRECVAESGFSSRHMVIRNKLQFTYF